MDTLIPDPDPFASVVEAMDILYVQHIGDSTTIWIRGYRPYTFYTEAFEDRRENAIRQMAVLITTMSAEALQRQRALWDAEDEVPLDTSEDFVLAASEWQAMDAINLKLMCSL